MSKNRLSRCFERCRKEQRAALVAYLTAGDPSPAISERLLLTLANHADIIEIGMPFSDPAADGPAIQAASERALAAKTCMADVFHIAAHLREAHPDTGIVLMGYANVAYAMSYEVFAKKAVAAGVDGVLIVDIPPEEATDMDAALQQHGLSSIRLVAPTSTPARCALAAESASGFIYYVSLTGITGANIGDTNSIQHHVDTLRAQSGLPICVGFGIKTPEQAHDVALFADGVVVGSRFVSCIAGHLSDESAMQKTLEDAASSLRAAMKKVLNKS